MRIDPPIFMMFLFLAIGALLIWSSTWTRRRSIREAHERLARHFQGQARWNASAGWLGRPFTEFRHQGQAVHVEVAPFGAGLQRRNGATVCLAWPQVTPWLKVTLAGMVDRFSSPFDSHRLYHGEPWFRKRYAIRAGSAVATELLTPRVQAQLERVRATTPSLDVEFVIQNNVFTVRCGDELDVRGDFIGFVAAVLQLYEDIHAALGAGIDFNAPAVIQAAGAVCPVCGDAIERDPLLCLRCGTPHHRDCWTYNGRCATYGCTELRCREG